MTRTGASQKRTKSGKIAAAVFLAVVAPGAIQADTRSAVSVQDARVIARQALAAGDYEMAGRLSQALIAKNPEDFEARIIRAFVLREAGDLDGASAAATAAWRVARTDAMRFDAAFLAGEIATRQERYVSAKIWLRRADQFAPTPAAKAGVAQAYRIVAARSPVSVRLSFSVRPSDNLNNGSDIDDALTTSIGLSASTPPAISGIEAIGSADLTVRLSETRTQRTEAYASSYVRLAFPEDGFEDKLYDPTNPFSIRPSARDYDYVAVETGLRHSRLVFEELGPTTVQAGIGASYYESSHLANFVEAGVSQNVAFDDALLRVGLSVRLEDRVDSPTASYVSRTVSLDWFDRTEGGTQWSIGASATDYDSDSLVVDGHKVELRFHVAPDRPFWGGEEFWLGAKPDVGLSISRRVMPGFFDFTQPEPGRTDHTVRLTIGANYPGLTWYGFMPRVEFTRSETFSDLDLWDRSSYAVGVTLVSRF